MLGFFCGVTRDPWGHFSEQISLLCKISRSLGSETKLAGEIEVLNLGAKLKKKNTQEIIKKTMSIDPGRFLGVIKKKHRTI